MRFRTEIEQPLAGFTIDRDRRLLLLGSCFSDNIGSRLARDGFETMINPFGALYNPFSIAKLLDHVAAGETYTRYDLTPGPRGWHCLDFSTTFSGSDPDRLLSEINSTMDSLKDFLSKSPVVIITFGTAFYFRHIPSGSRPVGNCHKFPAQEFLRSRMSVANIVDRWNPICTDLHDSGCNLIFTVSPIRHLADGLHGNNLSKSTLLLAVDSLLSKAVGDYFPAYEAVIDDLRDYRFYAADMKHPSETAGDYIYELFCNTYFSPATMTAALESRRQFLRSSHRPILPSD